MSKEQDDRISRKIAEKYERDRAAALAAQSVVQPDHEAGEFLLAACREAMDAATDRGWALSAIACLPKDDAPAMRKIASDALLGKAQPAQDERDLPQPKIVVTDTGHAWNYETNKDVKGQHFYSTDQMRAAMSAPIAGGSK